MFTNSLGHVKQIFGGLAGQGGMLGVSCPEAGCREGSSCGAHGWILWGVVFRDEGKSGVIRGAPGWPVFVQCSS